MDAGTELDQNDGVSVDLSSFESPFIGIGSGS
jgi:hypothetical protein